MAIRRKRISPRARRLFRQLQAETEGTSRWWEIQGELHEEFGLKPWEWPAVIRPDAKTDSEAGSYAEQCDNEARARYDGLRR